MSNNTPSGKKPEMTLASSVWRQLRFLSLQLSLKTVYLDNLNYASEKLDNETLIKQ